MSFGPGSAFAFSLPASTNRPPRRAASSASFEDDKASSNGHPGSLPASPLTPHQRSFSSILSPSLPATNESVQDDLSGKPFVYSRDFLLSLYDEEKASRRPLELARHEVATRDKGGKPWALGDWREGEKELFTTSLHPPTSRTSASSNLSTTPRTTQLHRSESSSNTLDLGSLGILPRDRDRAALPASPSVSTLRSPLGAGIAPAGSPSSALGDARRVRGISSIAGAMETRPLGGLARKDSAGSIGTPTKEPWQGGRWRRGGTAELEDLATPEKRGWSARSPGHLDDSIATSPTREESIAVPVHWDGDDPIKSQAQAAPVPSSTQYEETDSLAHHASNVLASLALSPPTSAYDSLLSPSLSPLPPPGLSAPILAPAPERTWQYRDPSGQVQGPFAASLMHDWYRQSFFGGDLLVKRSEERDWERLDELVRRVGDVERPFLVVAPLPVAAPVQQSQPLWNQRDQFGGAGNGGSPFYEPFANNNNGVDPSRSSSQPGQNGSTGSYAGIQERSRSSGVDPWGAPLPEESSYQGQQQSWDGQNLFANGAGAYQQGGQNQLHHQQQQQRVQQQQYQQVQQQQPQQQLHQQQYMQHQAPQQQQHQSFDAYGRQESIDVFGRAQVQQQSQQQQQQQQHQQSPAVAASPSPYFDPSQLSAPAAAPAANDWGRAPQQQPIQIAPIGGDAWTSIISSSVAPLPVAPVEATPAAPSPIGPPATIPAPQAEVVAVVVPVVAPVQPTPAPVSPWGTLPAKEAVSIPSLEPVAAAAPVPVVAPIVVGPIAKLSATTRLRESAQASAALAAAAAAPAPLPVASLPTTVPQPTVATPTKTSPAPWLKEEDAGSLPSSPRSTTPAGPSLRQIQELEARQSELRKQAERQASARTQALAAVQAAQRAAAAEADTLPSTSTWAAPAAPAAAPWSAKAKVGGTKTMKEIQEEEEERRKVAAKATAAAQGTVIASTARGYAGSIGGLGQVKPVLPGAPWTTVGIKPAASPAPAVRPLIPGGSGLTPRVVSAPVVPLNKATIVSARAAVAVLAAVPSRPSSRTTNGTTYDADSPPPPSSEFMKWCRDALKGLTVPNMDEFIQMLLSFPLDASPDVLEIISDSVYANSSTLDGRRFANDYASRRKLDVAARHPSIVMRKDASAIKLGGRPSSMADALKSQPTVKQPEWSVKVAGGKKKKGGN